MKLISKLLFVSVLLITAESNAQKQLSIVKQGTFSAGGSVIKSEGTFDALKPWSDKQGGQTRHGDHADVFYQIPNKAKQNALVFLHGYGQSKRSWQTTADGRDGFDNIFLRKNFSVYLVDQPGRGAAGQTIKPIQVNVTPDDQTWFTQFRIGQYPKFYEGVQFTKDEQALDQFYRMMTPNTGIVDEETIVSAMSAVFEKSGNGILFTHSAGGAPGWKVAIRNDKVKAVVAIEPGGFCFPEGFAPQGSRGGRTVSMEDFKKLTKIPIVIYYGDFIPKEETNAASLNFWRNVLATAKQWAALVNENGGQATVVELPEIGLKGNTHFAMSDLNNLEFADVISKWFKQKGLDK
ncbi:alpha/beta fold hydrolase [Pedobacter aquatilis]|uniref:alpha/beta hydrolase n=1 Tax=Pedobacter aquatilis TaxID=351343 RepID=UPI00293032F3|nr:alpha/beta fold hydrolase [Pedobacter aquatilis]